MRNVGAASAVTFVLAMLLSASCSSSPHITSLDSSKTLSSLTKEERRQYCEDQFRYMTSRINKDDRQKINCSMAASTVGNGGETDTARARAACQTVYKACASVPAEEPQSACDAYPGAAENCGATVGDLTACAEAQADALQKLASKADGTCDHLDQSASRARAAESTKLPDACARVQALCPKVLEEPSLDITPR